MVGRYAGVAELGVYALAFTLAFAPVTQLAWQIGKVLFASAARTDEAAAVAARAARAARLSALLVWPLVVPAVVLAPLALPSLLGSEWRPMVVPFQLLLAAGAVHAVLAVIREFVLGRGAVRHCLAIDVSWLVATVLALLALVPRYGIVGAAVAHVVLVVPLACAYVIVAARRFALTPAALWRSMRLVVAAVAVQTAMTGSEAALVRWAGATPLTAAAVGVATGAVALCLLLEGGETPPRKELAAVARAVRAARTESVAVRRAEPVVVRPAEPVAGAPATNAPAARADAPVAARALPGGRSRAWRPLRARPWWRSWAGPSPPTSRTWRRRAWAPGSPRCSPCVLPPFTCSALVALTTIVPLAVQARFGSGGSLESAGVLPSDVLLLTGLGRALLVLPRQPLRRLTSAAMALTAVFLLAGLLQLVHALVLGRPISGVGGEFRALLGFGVLFVALPVLADPRQRRLLLKGLGWLGLALGVWGMAQFAFHLQFTDADLPVRPGQLPDRRANRRAVRVPRRRDARAGRAQWRSRAPARRPGAAHRGGRDQSRGRRHDLRADVPARDAGRLRARLPARNVDPANAAGPARARGHRAQRRSSSRCWRRPRCPPTATGCSRSPAWGPIRRSSIEQWRAGSWGSRSAHIPSSAPRSGPRS